VPPPQDLDALVQTRQVIVCVGSGGVGKTTMAAAIALKAAERGRSVCVVTIDPARRLATAMGLPALGNTETRVGDERFEAAGIPAPSGELWAMTLDTKRTWDDLVARFATDRAQARRILENHYYQQLSTALAGSQEFMAMEKLYELHQSRKYDLLVLDTPPTRHALDFLDAPRKMMGFMDETVLEPFLASSLLAGKWGLGFLTNSSAWMFRILERITGFTVMRDVADFIGSFTGMHAGFQERAAKVETLLRAPASTFVLVTSPNPITVDEATYFYRKLAGKRLPFGGFIVNRVHPDALQEPGAKDAWEAMRHDPARMLRILGLDSSPQLAERMADNFAHLQELAATDAAQLARLEKACTGPHFWRPVPALDADVHDLSGLARVNQHLFAGRG
jgi:anion-transporting  ArsA/GET3 family ATPase